MEVRVINRKYEFFDLPVELLGEFQRMVTRDVEGCLDLSLTPWFDYELNQCSGEKPMERTLFKIGM